MTVVPSDPMTVVPIDLLLMSAQTRAAFLPDAPGGSVRLGSGARTGLNRRISAPNGHEHEHLAGIWGIDRLLRSRGENPGNSAGPRTEAI